MTTKTQYSARSIAMIALCALLSSCNSRWAIWQAAPAHLTVRIGDATCTDPNVATVVRDSIAKSILDHTDFLSLADPGDKNAFIISATVTFGHGSSANGNSFFTGESNSSAGEFVNDVSCVAHYADGRVFAVSEHGQSLRGGGSLESPSRVTLRAMNGIIDRLSEYARTGK